MKIVVMGSGAIGSLYGGLIEKYNPGLVTLVGRPSHVTAIQKDGLKVKGVLGEFTVKIDAVSNPSSITKADAVFITTKTYDTIKAAKKIEHLVKSGAFVLIIQNGIGTEKLVAKALNTTKVLRATTCMGALITRSGEVTITGDGLTEVGTHYPENHESVESIVNILKEAGFNVRSSDNIDGVVWTKTVVNCGINPIGALTGMKNGDVYSNLVLRDLVVRLVQETARVADALNISLTTENPIRYTLGTAKATSENINSMLQDILARKKTEIDSITGEVIRIGQELGIETPVSETVYALIKAIESKYMDAEDERDSETPLTPEELLGVISTP